MNKHNSIVIIPCFNRPEFLTLCLERIRSAYGFQNHTYLFAIDFGYNRKIDDVITDFVQYAEVERLYTERTSLAITKQSFNLLNAYRCAYRFGAETVFMIEEDVLIAKDFFQWHNLVHEQQPNIFCSIATANNNRKILTSGERDEYYITTGDYQSLGVCFKRKMLELILPHFNSEYLNNPFRYVRTKFRLSSIGESFCEQDGLIRRIEEKEKIGIAFPFQARAYHAGFFGKNRGQQLYGSYEKRLEEIRNTVFSDEKMKYVNRRNPHLYEDSKPVPLDTDETINIKLKTIHDN